MPSEKITTLSSFTWSIADILRGDFKQSEYGKVILPFAVLRRLDCILEPTKDAVLAANDALPDGIDDDTRDLSKSFNERHGTQFTNEDLQRFEQVNREILDDDLVEMLRNNPPDIVYTAFREAFFKGAINLFQRDAAMKSIVLTDAQAREHATRHFFNRALRAARA